MSRKPSAGNAAQLPLPSGVEVDFSPGKVVDPGVPLRDILLAAEQPRLSEMLGGGPVTIDVVLPPLPPAEQPRRTKIRPGIMVSLRPRCRGGVTYVREDQDEQEMVNGGIQNTWVTKRVVENPAETERAKKTISKAGSLVRAVCVSTNFGLLCPLEREQELDAAWREARRMVSEHNAAAETTNLSIYMLKGQVAGTDEEAARSITEEVRSLVEQMDSAIGRLDVDAVREAASKAKAMEDLLAAEQAEKVGLAVKAARAAARLITKRAGEDPKLVLLDVQRGDIERARMAFLDFGEDAVVEGERMPEANVQRFAAIEDDYLGGDELAGAEAQADQ